MVRMRNLSRRAVRLLAATIAAWAVAAGGGTTAQARPLTIAVGSDVTSLDPHSNYMEPTDYADVQEDTSGQFGGLGIEVQMEEGIVKVVSPIDETPAARAGILAGDMIVELDGMQVQGMSLDDVRRAISAANAWRDAASAVFNSSSCAATARATSRSAAAASRCAVALSRSAMAASRSAVAVARAARAASRAADAAPAAASAARAAASYLDARSCKLSSWLHVGALPLEARLPET